jgi:hypothetical protein
VNTFCEQHNLKDYAMMPWLIALTICLAIVPGSASAESFGDWTASQSVYSDTKAIHAGGYLKEKGGRGRFIVKCVAGGTAHITLLLMPKIGPADDTETTVTLSFDGGMPLRRDMGWTTLGGAAPLRAIGDADIARTETTIEMLAVLGQLRMLKSTLTVTVGFDTIEPLIFDAKGSEPAINFLAEKCGLKLQR